MDEEFYEDEEFEDEEDGLYDEEEEIAEPGNVASEETLNTEKSDTPENLEHPQAESREISDDMEHPQAHTETKQHVEKENPVMEMLAKDAAHDKANDKQENPNVKKENADDADDLPPEEFIARVEREYLEKNPDMESWHELRSQLRSALRLGIRQKQLAAMMNDKYSYEQREVIKYFLFIRVPDKLLSELSPNMKPSEMAAHYDLYRAEGTFAGMIDGPLNSMSKMVETYREDMSRFRIQAEKEMQKLKEEIAANEVKIAEKEKEIQALTEQMKKEKECLEAERKKQEEQEQIKRIAEQMAKEMIQKEKSDNDRFEEEMKRRMGAAYVPSAGANGAVSQPAAEPKADKEKKKRKRFGKKKKEAVEEVKPVIMTKPGDLPADFDISTYMLNSDLTSSQMDVISFAVKCNVPDWTVKDMIDSNKDSQQLKQFLEVVLARRDREIAGSAQDNITETDIIYDNENETEE